MCEKLSKQAIKSLLIEFLCLVLLFLFIFWYVISLCFRLILLHFDCRFQIQKSYNVLNCSEIRKGFPNSCFVCLDDSQRGYGIPLWYFFHHSFVLVHTSSNCICDVCALQFLLLLALIIPILVCFWSSYIRLFPFLTVSPVTVIQS